MRTAATSISLSAGKHVVRFPDAGTEARIILEREGVGNQRIERPHMIAHAMYSWTVDLPERRAPMTLALLESYNTAWRLTGVVRADHFVLNGYANGWLLSPGPPERVTIYYAGQTWLRAGAAIAGATLVILLVMLGLSLRQERSA